MIKLSILIPALISRADSLSILESELKRQASELNISDKIQICIEIDSGQMSIGEKRNALMKQARGEYICFIDDDDEVSKDYLKLIFQKIMLDCCSLTGVITWNGERAEIFEHSIKYSAYKTNEHNEPKYERYPNHLNVIRADIAKKFLFPEINFGEDTDYATQIFKSGEIKNEAYIPEILYHYKFKTKK